MIYTEEQRKNRMKMIRRMYDQGKTLSEIGRAVGVASSTVAYWLRAEAHPMRSVQRKCECPDIKLLKSLAGEGYLQKEIASKMGVSIWRIQRWMKEYEVAQNPNARRERERAKRKKKKCQTCIYRGMTYGAERCNYILKNDGHHRRGCSVYACDKYVKGKKIKDICDPKWKHTLIT